MKIFQPESLCMKGQPLTVDHPFGFPNDEYPNAETYCYHDFYEMEFFTQGEGFHYLNCTPYVVKPGYLYLLFPGDYHYMQLDTEVFYNMWNLKMAHSEPNRRLLNEIGKYPRPYCVYLDEDETAFIQKEFEFLYRCKEDNSWNYEMRLNIGERILTVLLYKLNQRSDPIIASDREQIWTVIDFIAQNYGHQILLKDIASLMHMSEQYVGEWFQKHTGMRFTQYLNQTRLFYAANYLEESRLSIKEIAQRVGFSSPEYFARQFSENMGVSPSQYRKSIHRK